MVMGSCVKCDHAAGPSRVMPNSAILECSASVAFKRCDTWLPKMHIHGPLNPDHLGTSDIGTTCHRSVSEHGLVVSQVSPLLLSEVFCPLLLQVSGVSPPLLSVSDVGLPFAGLGLPVLLTAVTVSARYSTPCPPVRLGCRDCFGNLNGRYICPPSPNQRTTMVPNRLPLSLMPAEWILNPGGCSNSFLRLGGNSVARGVILWPLAGLL